MIASIPPDLDSGLTPHSLSASPSPASVRAAQAAAGSRHGLLNLTRLVRALDRQVPAGQGSARPAADVGSVDVKKTWETVLYARALADALRDGNEEASTTSRDLDSLSDTLTSIQSRFQRLNEARPTTPAFSKPALFTLPSTTVILLEPEPSLAIPPVEPITLSSPDVSGPSPEPIISQPSASSIPDGPAPVSISQPAPSLRRRNVPDTADYLRSIAQEDLRGGEAGLLPIRTRPGQGGASGASKTGARDQLLGTQVGSVGSTQLHEELGGQLVGMSHQLRMNAVHFASSLEEEKALLTSSQDVLEKNLSSTRSSKAQLSSVSSKGRGTTCLTIGVVVLVLVLFIWTYLLIRFT